MNHKRRGLTPLMTAVRVAIAVALAILLLWYGRKMSETILPGMNSSRTTSMEPIQLVLHDREDDQELSLRVPKAYLTAAENWRGGPQNSISIETQLPSLKPTQAVPAPPHPDNPDYARWLKESDGGIYIYLDSKYSNLSGNEVRERWMMTYAAGADQKSLVGYALISNQQFGLTGYRSLSCDAPAGAPEQLGEAEWRCQDSYREYYISNDGDPAVHIACHLRSATGIWEARRGCEAQTSFRGFSLRYVFRHTQLSRWHEFDAGARRLLESFVIPERQH